MTLTRTRQAYAARSAEYIQLFGSIDAAAEQDRDSLLSWAHGVQGRIIDVGCGPGQWTHHLSESGADVEGVDPVHEFIEEARQNFPDVHYRVGHADHLEVPDASLGGVLAWYSLIHTDPAYIDVTLAEFARCVRHGGRLAVGFFEGPELMPFDHAVTTAYFWPLDQLAAHIERAGFTVTDARARNDPSARRQGIIVAQRRHD